MGPSQMTSVQSGSLPSLDLLVVFFILSVLTSSTFHFHFFVQGIFFCFWAASLKSIRLLQQGLP